MPGGAATRQDERPPGASGPATLAKNIVTGDVRPLIDATPKIPLVVTVAPIQAHETHWPWALVTQAQATLVGAAWLHQVVWDQGVGEGPELWWLDQPGMCYRGPAEANLAVTADARVPAAAGAGLPMGRRVHTGD